MNVNPDSVSCLPKYLVGDEIPRPEVFPARTP